MPIFSYRIARPNGSLAEDKIEADTEEVLRKQFEREGCLILSIKRRGSISVTLPLFSLRRKLKGEEFLIFNQEFLALAKAGLPIIKILDLLIDRTVHPRFKEVLQGVRSEIIAGSSISNAMLKYSGYFPEFYVYSLRAAEGSGNLAEVLVRYISYLKRMITLRKKVISALAYPGFLIIVGISVVIFLLTYVLPTFSEIYGGAQEGLPVATRILISVVQSLKIWLFYIIIVCIALAFAFRFWRRTEKGRRRVDMLLLRIPLVGEIITMGNIVHITRTLSTILNSGISMVPALEMVSRTVRNHSLSNRICRVTEMVKEGKGLAEALKYLGLFPKMSLEMISVGELTGNIEEMFTTVAEFHEDELDLHLARLTTWIEPILLLIMGGIIGTIVIIMYLPIFNLAGTIR